MTTPNLPTKKAATIRDLLDKSKEQIALALPKHMNADRLLRVAMTSIQNTPKLLDCDPRSLIGAIVQSAQLGLEPDGVLGEAYLIPFGDKVQFIVGYKGLISLARRSGQIKSIAAHVVYENDVFEFEYGLDEKLRHIPTLKEKGPMLAVYAVAKLIDGGYAIEVMSMDEVNTIRDGSQGYKAAKKYKKDSPWDTNYPEMARKTVLRRLSKYLPVSVEMMRAVALDEQADSGIIQEQVVQFNTQPTATKAVTESLNNRFSDDVIDVESPEETVDENTLSSEMNKINKLADTVAVDKWRFANSERISSTMNQPTATAVLQYAADVYSRLKRDEEEAETTTE